MYAVLVRAKNVVRSFGRLVLTSALAIGLLLPASGLLTGDARAQQADGIVCGKLKKGTLKRARLTAGPTCKKKEQKLIDFGDTVTAPCAGNPNLKLLTSFRQNACRVYDGDEANCLASYQVLFGEACWYYRGKCIPCTRAIESITGPGGPACADSCAVRPPCADGGRTLFAGWPSNEACDDITSEATCNTAWAVTNNNDSTDEYAVSCYWDPTDTRCRGCGLFKERASSCTNTCGTPAQATCGGRTLAKTCSEGLPMEAACNTRYVLGDYGLPQSCYYSLNTCRECDLEASMTGKCENACP